jgi:hypothetical protein
MEKQDLEFLRELVLSMFKTITKLTIEVESVKLALTVQRPFGEMLDQARTLTAKNFEPILKQLEETPADKLLDILRKYEGPVQ